MTTPQIKLALASREPQKLAKFYSYILDVGFEPGFNNDHWQISHPKGITLDFYKPSNLRTFPEKGRALSICLSLNPSINPIEEIHNVVKNLILNGAQYVEDPRTESFGVESWVSDPEGNYFLILIPYK